VTLLVFIGAGVAGILESELPVYQSPSDIKSGVLQKQPFVEKHWQCSTDGELRCKIPALLTDIKDWQC